MTTVTVRLSFRDNEFEVIAEGEVTHVPHRQGHMDEQPGTYVEAVEYYSPKTGRKVSQRLHKFIEKAHGDYVADCLAEEYMF